MSEQELDRSEAPTQFKLERARRKGTVARSVDLGFAASLAAFIGWLLMIAPGMQASMGEVSRRTLVAAFNVTSSPNEIQIVSATALASVVRPLAFLAGAVFVVVLVLEIVQTGFVFSGEPLKPDFSRMNPAKTLKRLFSMRTLIETGKNVLKLAVYTAVAVLVVRRSLTVAAPTIADGVGLARALPQAALMLALAFAGIAALFAAFDQMIVRRQFLKQMRMSRRELKRESRDREGDPRLKQRRKQLHAEFVKQSKSLRNVRGADMLITNPTHFAVGLKYDPAALDAPVVVARGANDFAQRLKRLAFIYGVPTIEDRALAQALYRASEIDQPVPEMHFRPVANHYLALRAQRTARSATPAKQSHA